MNYTILVLVAYTVIMIIATLLMTKKEDNVEKFCVADRNMGWFTSALSIAATWNEAGGNIPIVRVLQRRLLEDDDKLGKRIFKG